MRTPPSILTIAGSDSGGGAGIQADLKTISMLGGFGLSVITALTAQNSRWVTGIEAPPAEFAALQLRTVLDDFSIAAAKTGMLFSSGIINALADELENKSFPLVVDPVCISQSGHKLLEDDAVDALRQRMLPLTDLLTPNRPEAELLADMPIDGEDSLGKAAARLMDMGAGAVLIKGGHFEESELGQGRMMDWLFIPGSDVQILQQPRVETANTHGTGCTLSAAIATGLGHGLGLREAIVGAQAYLNLGLRAGFAPGHGDGPPNHLAPLVRASRTREVLQELEQAAARLCAMPGVWQLIPEVRMNLAQALPWASGYFDVAAFGGRITSDRQGRVMIPGGAAFGASSHMARVVLAGASVNPEVGAAACIRFNDRVLAGLERAGFVLAWFDRAEEPEELKPVEGSTLEWGTRTALTRAPDPGAVDAVCDRGETGKEPIIRILGRDCRQVVDKIERLLAELPDPQQGAKT